MSKKKTSTKSATPKPAADEATVAIPMTSGKGAARKIAHETARIATKAIERADKANAKPADDKSQVKMSQVGKKKPSAKTGKRSGMSGLDAAAKVLADPGKPLTSQEMVEAMTKGGLWKTSGKTPHATIYAAIIREIAKKGSASRFRKTDRGHFTVARNAK